MTDADIITVANWDENDVPKVVECVLRDCPRGLPSMRRVC